MPQPTAAHELPSLYIPHGGGPCFFMEWTMGPRDTWDRMAAWLRQLGETIQPRPRAIVVISGHWEQEIATVTGAAHPELIYDYYGFPAHTYALQYAPPGDPVLAQEIVSLLKQAGLPARIDPQRGLDHGVFVPFKLIYPEADIPMVQLSLLASLDPAEHLRIGQALASLRRDGVLIVGSGMSFHNMRGFGGGYETVSAQFDAWLTRTVCQQNAAERDAQLVEWQQAPAARLAHPREEHLLPLFVAAGAAAAPGVRLFSDVVMQVTVSAYQFGVPNPATGGQAAP